MCNFKDGFILCKCNDPKVTVHNKKSRRNKNKQQTIEYKWTLYKFIGMSKQTEIGKYTIPINDLGDGLTSDFVLNELNKRNCFDFEYKPNEGDNLIINNENSFDRIEFIFKNGGWIKDHYSPFNHISEKFDSGKITSPL